MNKTFELIALFFLFHPTLKNEEHEFLALELYTFCHDIFLGTHSSISRIAVIDGNKTSVEKILLQHMAYTSNLLPPHSLYTSIIFRKMAMNYAYEYIFRI